MTSAALPRFVVFGEALTDFVRIGAQTWHSVAGGACWNVARVTATLGVSTGWGGSVSDDFFGHEIVEKSQQAGLDMRFLQVVDRPPLIAIVHQTHPPQYFFLGTETADLAFDESRLPRGWMEACELVHFGCISLVRQPLGERLVRIAEELATKGIRISFDPNYRNLMGPDYPLLFERMARIANIIKISDEDLAQIYPDEDRQTALARVRKLAPSAEILFTRGVEGGALYRPDGVVEHTAIRVKVADTVGAGDAFIGGFIASLLARPAQDSSAHLRFAVATAAMACTQPGAYAATMAQVDALLAQEATA